MTYIFEPDFSSNPCARSTLGKPMPAELAASAASRKKRRRDQTSPGGVFLLAVIKLMLAGVSSERRAACGFQK
jgi:hypothetical protein